MAHPKYSVGNRILELRKKAGYTQAQLAEYIGIHEKNISAIERGLYGLSMNTLIALCETLGTSADYILFGKTTKSINNHIQELLSQLDPDQQLDAEQLLELYVKACKGR